MLKDERISGAFLAGSEASLDNTGIEGIGTLDVTVDFVKVRGLRNARSREAASVAGGQSGKRAVRGWEVLFGFGIGC